MKNSINIFLFVLFCTVALWQPVLHASWFRFNDGARKHVELGKYVAQMGDYERAALHYEKALEEKPRSKPVMYTLGALYQKMGDYDKAGAMYEKMLKYYPLDSAVNMCMGNVYLSMNDPVTAITWYRKATDLNHDDGVAYRNLGFAQIMGGAIHGAVESLERACELAPDDPLAQIDLAIAYYQSDRFDDARKCIETALKKHNSAEVRVTYADVLKACAGTRFADAVNAFNSNDFTRAEQLLSIVVDKYPDFTLAWTYLGHGYHHRKPSEPGKAEAAYRKAIETHERAPVDKTTYAVLLDNLGMIRFNFGDFEEAEKLFAKGVSLDTAYPVVYFNYGLTLAHREAYALASIAFADAVRRDPDFINYLHHHAALDDFRKTQAYTNVITTFSHQPLPPITE